MTNVNYIAVVGLGAMATVALLSFALLMNASAVRVPQQLTTADFSLFGLGLAGMLIRRNRRC